MITTQPPNRVKTVKNLPYLQQNNDKSAENKSAMHLALEPLYRLNDVTVIKVAAYIFATNNGARIWAV